MPYMWLSLFGKTMDVDMIFSSTVEDSTIVEGD
jgi:hypothetical protein